MSKRVFSGIQPSGSVHIGNYLGAIKQWVRLQEDHHCFFSIVDYHAITVPYNPEEIQTSIFAAAIDNIAAGLDPEKSTIFVQSHVKEHTELAWLLNTIAPVGRLSHMTQYKEKSRIFKDAANAGVFNYPVLQAADILLYKAALVPVGEDQVQHIELTRDIARKFNGTFGQTFPEVAPLLSEAPRIMALSDPARKMSKSVPGGSISLTDPPEVIREAVMRSVTDSGPESTQSMSPGVANLFALMREFSSHDAFSHFSKQYEDGKIRYSEMKKQLAEDVVLTLAPIRERAADLSSDLLAVRSILELGAETARIIAKQTIVEVKLRMGLT